VDSAFFVTTGTLIALTQDGRQFWVRDEAGRDHAFPYDYTMLPMLPGHRVTVVDAGSDEYGITRICLLINYATGMHALYRHRLPYWHPTGAGCLPFFLMAFGAFVAAIGAGTGPAGANVALFASVILIGSGVQGCRNTMRNNAEVERHNAQLRDELDRALYEQTVIYGHGDKIYR
jgi:hypothetical protein